MFLELPEKKFTATSSKSLKMSNLHPYTFNLYDNIVPQRLRESLMSQSELISSQPSQLMTISSSVTVEEMIFKRDSKTTTTFNAPLNSTSTEMLLSISDNDDNENDEIKDELWEMPKMCPNDCNCGECPLSDGNSSVSLFSNYSTISLPETSPSLSYLSISYVMPLRNYGAIIRWNVNVYQHGIRGYKIFIDGRQVSSVHSPSRMSALLESVNMKIPHHFAVSIIASEKIPMLLYRNMHAVYVYKPNNFIH